MSRHPVKPIADGKQCAVDSMGFYIMEAEQQPAPATRPFGDECQKEEAFWVMCVSQHIALFRLKSDGSTSGPPSGNLDNVLPTASGSPPAEEPSEVFEESEADAVARRLEATTTAANEHSQSALDRAAADLAARMRKRIRRHKGLPYPRLRKLVWPFFSGALRQTPGGPSAVQRSMLYSQFVNVTISEELNDVILRDLGRTFPTHCLFKDTGSHGQATLHRILTAYCAFDPDVGYCQGMGFIVAVLLLHMPEEQAFWVLVQLMYSKHFAMRQLYLPGFPLLQQFFVLFRQLSKRLLPSLTAHFEAEGVDVSFYAAQWFMTLFAYQFPIDVVSRIWDVFFAEGWKFIFKLSIALLQMEEVTLRDMRMEEILLALKTVHEGKEAEDLIRRALDVPVRERDLRIES